MNQGHGYLGSRGSGWASEQTGRVRAWWRLTKVSVRAATGGSVWQGATSAMAKMAVTESGELKERRQQWKSAAVEAGRCRASLGGEGM